MATTPVLLKMAVSGPHKHEPAKRRVRGLLGGRWVFDTLDAEFVWEHSYYPLFYVPLDALKEGAGKVLLQNQEHDGLAMGFLQCNGQSAELASFETGPLTGLVKVSAPGTILEWYAEDEKLLSHPKDPYKRVECLASTREIRFELDGIVIARSSSNVFLLETGLRPRYYLPPTAVVDWSLLRPSDTTSICPYKGQAQYYHLRVGSREIPDAVWYYDHPTQESAAIQGRLSFYNEKFEVFVNGKKEVV